MKKIGILLALLPIISLAQVKKPKVKLPKSATKVINSATSVLPSTSALDISAGLKEALDNGITKQVSKLALEDGFYNNEAVKILIPDELQGVEAKLRKFGMGHLADQGILAMNRAAEDAVKEATPIFVTAVKNMSITDAKTILLGNDNAATSYLQGATSKELYSKFSPVVQQSIGKVGADVVWSSIITKYNEIPFVNKVDPNITDYVTNKAMEGVFKMIAVEEKNIRTDLKSRTSSLLQQVFAIQDKTK